MKLNTGKAKIWKRKNLKNLIFQHPTCQNTVYNTVLIIYCIYFRLMQHFFCTVMLVKCRFSEWYRWKTTSWTLCCVMLIILSHFGFVDTDNYAFACIKNEWYLKLDAVSALKNVHFIMWDWLLTISLTNICFSDYDAIKEQWADFKCAIQKI